MSTSSALQIGVLDYYERNIRQQLQSEFPDMELSFAEGSSHDLRIAAAHDADVLLAGWSEVDAEIIEASPRLRLIQKMGVGVDKIDLAAAQARNITVLRAAGINADAVAEMTIMLMLAVLREFPWAVSELRQGRFQKEALRDRTVQLFGHRVGLVGFGHIGIAVATRLRAFGVEVGYSDPRQDLTTDPSLATRMELDKLLPWSDIVSLHIPLLPETRFLLDRTRIASLRHGAVVINTARGGLIDEAALCEAIREGRLRGAGLDVTEQEPLPVDSPLLSMDRVIVTPHMAGAVASNFQNVVHRARSNISRFFAGEPVEADDVVC